LHNVERYSIDLKITVHYFKSAVDQSFVEAKYRYAISLIIDDAVYQNFAEIFRYLKLSVQNCSGSGQLTVGSMTENVIVIFRFTDVLMVIRHSERCFDCSPVDSVCFECRLRIGRGIPIDFTIVVEFLKKGVDLDGMNSFDCCFKKVKTSIKILIGLFDIIEELHHFHSQMECMIFVIVWAVTKTFSKICLKQSNIIIYRLN
jgi:hypothetical protein